MEFIYDNLSRAKVPDDIMHPTARELFRFWESARGEMAAAKKQSMQLSKISKILSHVCILERNVHQQSYVWRLAGSGICRLWGKELTGTDVLETWPEFEKQTMASGFDMVVAMLQPCVSRFKAVNSFGSEIGIEFLCLPIQDSKTGAIQILGTVVPFRSPDWLGTRELVSFELSAMRKIWTDALPGDDIAENSGFQPRTAKKSPPFLKVIEGGRNR